LGGLKVRWDQPNNSFGFGYAGIGSSIFDDPTSLQPFDFESPGGSAISSVMLPTSSAVQRQQRTTAFGTRQTGIPHD
jgi:hypothetical protein